MVSYKLTYFHGRGPAEAARLLFVLAGQPFEDHRIVWDQLAPLKPGLPFGQLPILEEDGEVLGQSCAIARYLAKKFGFAGKTAWEEGLVDAFADQMKDFRNDIMPYVSAYFGHGNGQDLETLRKEHFDPSVKKHLPFFETALKKNTSGFLVGDDVTWADLVFFGNVTSIKNMAPHTLEEFPEVMKHLEKIGHLPKIKEWLEKNPKTDF